MATERETHLAWCKERATAYVKSGDLTSAVSSMLSDMDKHPDTSLRSPTGGALGMIGIMEVRNGAAAVQRWIDGFN